MQWKDAPPPHNPHPHQGSMILATISEKLEPPGPEIDAKWNFKIKMFIYTTDSKMPISILYALLINAHF
jgi:hypothetical protein